MPATPRSSRWCASSAEGLGIPKNDVVPVSLAPDRAPYNIEQLAGRIAARVPEARQAQLLRLMEDAAPRWSVRRLLGQTGNVALVGRQVGDADEVAQALTRSGGGARLGDSGSRLDAHGLDLLRGAAFAVGARRVEAEAYASRSVVAVASTGMLSMIGGVGLRFLIQLPEAAENGVSGTDRFKRRTRKRACALLSRTSSADTQMSRTPSRSSALRLP